jgi:hypothetical protein
MAMNPMNPYGMMPWAMPTMPNLFQGNPMTPITPTPAPPVAQASGSRTSPAFPSSDPPDMGAVSPYPEITDFLHELDGYQSRRRLLDYVTIFDELDFYNIDEIAKLKTAQELVKVAKISLGNATYIMDQVKAEMKRVDRARVASAL